MTDPHPLRCARLPEHAPHTWTRHPHIRGCRLVPAYTFACNGHVVSTLAEQEWADRADFDEARDDADRAWVREVAS